MVRLRRSTCSERGIRRVRRGRGFSYLDSDGTTVDAETRQRISDLAIPPAWTDVWICAHPNGHLQAVGTDAAGRRQYLYHPAWREKRDAEKHEHVLDLARVLPRARRRVSAHLRRTDLDRERVLAVAFRILDLGSFRIGSEAYTDSHDTFGLATLRRDQVDVAGRVVRFTFPGKLSKDVDASISDPALARTIGELIDRDDEHPDLLGWQNGDGWHDVRSDEVNDYVREVTAGEFTAKDFRTWNATVLMAAELAAAELPATRRGRERAIRAAVTVVAEHLNNTPTVARNSYIDPRLIDRYLQGERIDPALLSGRSQAARTRLERAVVALLAD